MTIPAVGIRFTGDVDGVAVAVRELTAQLQGLRSATKAQAGDAAAATRATADFAGRLRAATGATEPFGRGLLNIKNQEIAAAQAAVALGKAVDPIAAKMAQAAGGTEKFAAGLRTMKAQQEAGAGAQAKAAGSLLGFSGVAGLVTKTLGALGVGFGAVQIVGFIKNSIGAAAALHDLAQSSGATVETLSTLAFVGKRNGVTAEDLGVSFRLLARSLDQLGRGGEEATAAFAKIGLSARDLQGLTVDESFETIAKALARLPDGFEKSAAASAIFGRSGAELIPLLNELAQRGLPGLAREAAHAAAVISTEAADAADKFADSLDNLKSAAGGAAREIADPLLPRLTDLFKATQELFARKPGDTLRRDIDDLAHLADALTLKFFNLRQAANNALGGPPGGFDDRFHARGLGPVALAQRPGAVTDPKALEDEIRALAAIRDAGKLTEAQQARINALVAQLTSEYDAQGTTLTRQAAILRDLDSLTKTRKAGAEALTDAERQHLQLLKAQSEEAGRLLKAEAERRQVAADARFEEARAALKRQGGGDSFLSFDEFLARQPAKQRFAPLPGTEPLSNSEQAARTLAERQAETLAFVRQLQEEEAQAITLARELGAGLADAVGRGVSGVILDLSSLGEPDPNSGAIEARQRELEEVRQQLDEANQAAARGDEAAAARVQALSGDIGRLQDRIAGLKAETVGLDDVFVNALRNIAQAFQQALAQAIAFQAVTGLLGGGGIPAAPDGLGDLGQLAGLAPGFAIGGLAATGGGRRGPGDRRLAWFDPEEFIVRPAMTRRYLPLLRALNAGEEIPGFAAGGLVGPIDFSPSLLTPSLRTPGIPAAALPAEGTGGIRHQLAGELQVRLEEGLVLDQVESYLKTRQGELIVLRAIARNRRTVGDILD